MRIRDDDGKVTYVPWTNEMGCRGFKVVHDDGREVVIYLNPSGGSDDGVANVFLYIDDGDFSNPVHHYDLFRKD